MLSSSSSHRLLCLLNQALHSCKEEERQLEDQLKKYRKLLTDWKNDSCEDFNQEESGSQPQESKPSPEEVEEVELLNKALAKALKVRGSLRTESPNTPPTPQTMPDNPKTKEKTAEPLQKLVNTGTKTKTYQLKPPYKTMPEKRMVKGPTRPASSSARALPTQPPTSEKGNGGKDRPASNNAKSSPVQPLTFEKGNGGKDRSAENKDDPTRTDTTPGSLRSSVVPEMEYVASTPTNTDGRSSWPDQRRPQKALTLKDVGPTLKLPMEFQQLYRKNSRLWEKFSETLRVPAARPAFIQQLQTTFIAESPELSLCEIEEETARLQRATRRLQGSIDTAKTWQGSGPAHWQHYRTQLMLEAMQDEVAKSHCELQKLELVAEQYKNWCEKFSINTDCSEMAGCPPEFCGMPPVLIYSHPDQLRELTATHLRVQELQQKIYLHKVLSEELLAEADFQCRSSSPSYVVLRAIYTLLCEGGDNFPVLVHDDS
ncbi:LOW QUALITY PROTEIN: tubulin epsilon and delta complex protein 2 [Mantella aurantiaca]